MPDTITSYDTGRIAQPLDRRAREIVFGRPDEAAVLDDVPFYVAIDRAHAVMLVEQRILDADRGRRVLRAIEALVAGDYASLRGRPSIRGTYLLYEQWLIERLGEQDGGAIHLGRSRNDINATMLRLRLRPRYRRLVRELLWMVGVLHRRAARYVALTMPVYTHYQAALPITYGHYLAGVAVALLRDLQGIEDAVRDLDRCPLGAGAAGGTTMPIACLRTAHLLGFDEAVEHSLDAVASRDLVLRLLSAAVVLGITLSRLGTDLQLWSTAEFDLIRFPDTLVGSSSMMPQKRNAFLLEHIKGRGAAPLGAFTAAAMAMHGTPFSNAIAVGTEGVKPVWHALDELTEAIALTRLVVEGAEPNPSRMRCRAVEGFTAATEVANQLVLETGLSFRQAHHRVGEAVRAASDSGAPLALLDWPDPATVAAAAEQGGGPAEPSMRRILDESRRRAVGFAGALQARSRRWAAGRRALDAAVARLLATR
jgi:argininosuccinate lyase